MRVLHVLPTRASEYGGPIRVAEAFSAQVMRAGHSADIFPPSGAPASANRLAYWPGARALWSLRAKVRDVDLVHVHGLWTAPTTAAAICARASKRPYIITPHGMLDRWSLRQSAGRKRMYAAVVERGNLEAAAAIHFFHEDEREEATAFGIRAPTFLLPNGVDVDQFVGLPGRDALWRRYPETRNKKVVLFLGRIHPKKGLPLLVEAFSRAVVHFPDLHLVIAGPDEGGHLAEVEALVLAAKLERSVTFTGLVAGEDKRMLLGAADLFALTSHQEGDSVAVKEALAAGLPVIITHACHFRQVADEQVGILVNPVAREIQIALESLSGDDRRRAQMGADGRRLIERDYRWDMIGARLIAQYEAVLARHGGATSS